MRYQGSFWVRVFANERRHYIVTSSLIGWAHTQPDSWCMVLSNTVSGVCLFLSIATYNDKSSCQFYTTIKGLSFFASKHAIIQPLVILYVFRLLHEWNDEISSRIPWQLTKWQFLGIFHIYGWKCVLQILNTFMHNIDWNHIKIC